MKIVFLHGYSGSNANFKGLKNELEKKGYVVEDPKLPGHKSHLELHKMEFKDFVDWLNNYLDEKEKYVLIGYSLGAQMALAVSSRKNVIGVIGAATPIETNPPFKFKILKNLHKFKKFVKHNKYDEERKKDGSLRLIPTKGLLVMHQGNDVIRNISKKCNCPMLFIQNVNDYVVSTKSLKELEKIFPQAKTEIIKNDTDTHNPFDPEIIEYTKKIILNFIKGIK